MATAIGLQLQRDKSDFRATQRQTLKSAQRNFFRRSVNIGVAILALLAVLGLQSLENRSPDFSQLALLSLAFFGLWYSAIWVMTPYLQPTRPMILRWFCEPAELTVEDDGLRIRGALSSQFFSWSLLDGVVQTTTHVFLNCDGLPIITVPRRTFSSDGLAMDFVSKIRRSISAHVVK